MKKTYQEPSVEMMQLNPMTIVMGSFGISNTPVDENGEGD